MAREWAHATVAEVAQRVTKGTTPTTIGGRFVDAGIAFVKVESITDDGRFETEKFAFIDDETHRLLARSVLQEDDVLFTIAGTIGRVARVQRGILPANTTQAVAIVRPNRDVIDPRFLYYALRDELHVRHAHTRVVQSVQANFSLSELSGIEVPLPEMDEQRAIAHILGTLDDKIELNRRMNETLELMARAIFNSWFVDFDPVRAKAEGRDPGIPKHIVDLFPDRLEDSEVGEIPVRWKVKALSEVTAQITKGTTPTENDIANAPSSDMPINYLRVNAIADDGSTLYEKLTKIPESVHEGILKRSILRADDVVYTIAGTIGRVGVVDDDLLPANTNQAVAIIRPKPGIIPPGFLLLTMRQQAFREELHNNIVHAVQANLSLGMISRAKGVFPPLESLKKMFKPIQDLLGKATANRRESRTLAVLRDTLLPKLISSELRVKDAERFIGKAV